MLVDACTQLQKTTLSQSLDWSQSQQSTSWRSRAPEGKSEVQKDVELGPLIGQGAFGKVYRGMWNGAPVAVKVSACIFFVLSKVTLVSTLILRHSDAVKVLWHTQCVRPDNPSSLLSSFPSSLPPESPLVQ